MSYLCPKEVAAVLGVSPRQAQRLMSAGEIESFRVGVKLWRASPAALDAYVARQLARCRAAAQSQMILRPKPVNWRRLRAK